MVMKGCFTVNALVTGIYTLYQAKYVGVFPYYMEQLQKIYRKVIINSFAGIMII